MKTRLNKTRKATHRPAHLCLEGLESRRLLIANGLETTEFEYVGIVNDMCSGTLISPDVVLTSASCIDLNPDPINNFQLGETVYPGLFVTVHPFDDIAAITLEGFAEVGSAILGFDSPLEPGQEVQLVGYGASSDSPEFGTKRVGTTTIDEVFEDEIAWDAGAADATEGDIGGAIFADVDGAPALVGIISDGFALRLGFYADWVNALFEGFEGFDPEVAAQEELDGFDADGNGKLSEAELLIQFVEDFGFTEEDALVSVPDYLEQNDTDGDGELNFEELVATYITSPEDLAGFDIGFYDEDGNGQLNEDELFFQQVEAFFLTPEQATEQVPLLLEAWDSDGNGELSFEELVVSYGGEIVDEPELLPGDADGNGTVEFADFLILSGNFGTATDAVWSDGDFDGNGAVEFADFLILSGNFGESLDEV